MMIIGYENDGTPILAPEVNAPAVAPTDAGEDPLPPLEGMMDFEAGMQDMNGVRADTPEAVAADAASMPSTEARRAEPVVPTKGVHWDLQPIKQIASLYAAGNTEEANRMRDEYRNASPVNAYVYDNLRGKSRVTAQYAAGLADSYRQMQDRITMQKEDPLKQTQIADRKAKIAERAAVQNDFKVRRQAILKNIDDILNDPDYANLVGPIDGTVGGMYDAAFNQDMQAKRAKLDRLINIDVLDMTKYLRPISQDELKYLRTLVPSQKQHWEVYKQYLSEKRDMLKAADKAVVNPATNQALPSEDDAAASGSRPAPASSAPARNTFVYDGATYERLPDGTARLIE
jgi:hypothetical protein